MSLVPFYFKNIFALDVSVLCVLGWDVTGEDNLYKSPHVGPRIEIGWPGLVAGAFPAKPSRWLHLMSKKTEARRDQGKEPSEVHRRRGGEWPSWCLSLAFLKFTVTEPVFDPSLSDIYLWCWISWALCSSQKHGK